MIIYTDNITYASKVIPNYISWKLVQSENAVLDKSIISQIFQNKKVYFSDFDFNNHWKYYL